MRDLKYKDCSAPSKNAKGFSRGGVQLFRIKGRLADLDRLRWPQDLVLDLRRGKPGSGPFSPAHPRRRPHPGRNHGFLRFRVSDACRIVAAPAEQRRM